MTTAQEFVMTPQVTAFTWVPPFAQGYVRDLRVRWALEEAGLDYDAVLLNHEAVKSAEQRRWQPFGQVPSYRDGEVEMFESGAIVLYFAGKSSVLAPEGEAGLAQVSSWIFAALNSIEPLAWACLHFEPHMTPKVEGEGPSARAILEQRLADLAAWLGDRDYLLCRFTAADVIMGSVLRELVDGGVLAGFPTLDAYRRRCEARPAFGRAMAAQLAPFAENAPA
jgi:glutathione S-transferase